MRTERRTPINQIDYGLSFENNGAEHNPHSPGEAHGAPVDLNSAEPSTAVRLSVVVPTRNEELNASPLLMLLGQVLGPLAAEVIFVDDSDDGTPAALAAAAAKVPLPVRLLHRQPGSRRGGLSSAVIAGAHHARGKWVLVMDADLQHPPEAAAMLASTAMRHDADIVVGTRYAGGGSTGEGLAGMRRMLVSAWATRLAKSAFPRRLAMVSDPLSGLFAFRRGSVDLGRLRPTGFKLLLEILVRNPGAKVAEVAYCFAARNAGDSKASLRQGLEYLRHLARLRRARLARQLRQGPRTRQEQVTQAARFVAFGLVGLTGVGVNTAALWFFYGKVGWNHLLGASLATQVSTTWNFLLVDSLIYRKRAQGTRGGRAVRFFLMNNLLLLARLPVLQALVTWGAGVLTANAVTLVLLFLVRFLVSDRAIFGSGAGERSRDPVRVLVDLTAAAANGTGGRKRSRYLPYRYDIAGVVTIGSQIVLPELEFFRAQWVHDQEMDILVRVGDVGGRSPRRRASMTEYPDPAALRYEEHLGRMGANFRIDLSGPIVVEVGPLLAHSCHVVYTNIVEPLLRFAMVARDRMLLHSACVELDGVGVMLSALTDTGKTGTILRLLREHGGRFLSDDMTVIDAQGNASCFPKPLTISAHTLRAVRADDLTKSEWRRLQFQSRLHSKGGRSIGMTLSRFNVPIMGLNAVTQLLIPPPKYSVDRLVPCRMASTTRVRELFIIERGSPRLADLDHASALEQLIANTDDAYGFPPFRYLAPAITIDGRDYHELRAAERQILANFLTQVRLRTLASDTFGWADEIPRLITAPPGSPAAAPRENGHSPDSWPRWNGGPTRRFPAGRLAPADPHFQGLAAAGSRTPDPVTASHRLTGLAATVAAPPAPPAPPAPASAQGGPVVAAEGEPGPVADLPPAGPPPRAGWARVITLAAIVAVAVPAVALRIWHLNALGFNSDEAVYSGQAAAIAGDPSLHGLFPLFRAHPLLFQMAVSLIYRVHVSDLAPRVLAVAFGLATVAAGYAAGARIYGRRAGTVAALLLALMPYLVVVNRQGLLDGPMAFFSVAGLWLLAKFAASGRRTALYGAGGALGLAFISKETAIVLVPAAYAFLAVTPGVRARLKDVAIFFGSFAAVAVPYPISLAVAGGSASGRHFLTWQLFRPANHVWTFYFTVVPLAVGIPVMAAAAGMLVMAATAHRWTWRESLLTCWIGVPLLFFQLWPVKGFQYLLPLAAPLAVLAAGLLTHAGLARRVARGSEAVGQALAVSATGAVAAWLAVACWASINTANATSFLAGTGGIPGGRQAGVWAEAHTPGGSQMLAIGPSMANIVQFYGHREVLGLSVSPNPLHRNPAYTPVSNPDLLLRTGQVQYLVWDAYSAARSEYFSHRLMTYVRRYRGSVAHVESVTVSTPSGPVQRPVIVIYEVRP